MYKKINYEDNTDTYSESYNTKEEVIKDATRYYHEYFFKDDDYDINFEIKTFEQAIEFWKANGYEIR